VEITETVIKTRRRGDNYTGSLWPQSQNIRGGASSARDVQGDCANPVWQKKTVAGRKAAASKKKSDDESRRPGAPKLKKEFTGKRKWSLLLKRKKGRKAGAAVFKTRQGEPSTDKIRGLSSDEWSCRMGFSGEKRKKQEEKFCAVESEII